MNIPKPTWEELIEVIDKNIHIFVYLRKFPKKYRKAMATALSVAKWHPARGEKRGWGQCGLCALNIDKPCYECSLGNISPCRNEDSLWNQSARGGKEAKDQMYNLLIELYKKEYDAVD